MGGCQDGDQPEASFREGCVPINRSWASMPSTNSWLVWRTQKQKKEAKKTINKRIKRKQKMKNKIATHVDLQEALWALWTRNNCGRTKCSTPLPWHMSGTIAHTGSPGGHPWWCHLQCLLAHQDSPAPGLTTALTDTGWHYLWRCHLLMLPDSRQKLSSDITKKMNRGAPVPLHGFHLIWLIWGR